jgi:hypothetical protein
MKRPVPQNVDHRRGATSRGRVARAFRAVLWVLIVVAGCYVVRGYVGLWNEWRETARPMEQRETANVDPQLLASGLPIAGPWTFAQLEWDIRSQIVDSDEVAERFERLATKSPTSSDEQLPDISPEFIELAKSMGAKPVERGDNRVYQLDQPNLKTRLVVRIVGGKPKAVALAAAMPQSAEQWRFFELIPRGPTASNSFDTTPQLLPLPTGARRDGGRFADDGEPLLELISLDTTADELMATWKADGWEVRRSGESYDGNFSYLCARGSEVVYAFSADPVDALKNLMLVRTPDAADTNASAPGQSSSPDVPQE